MKKDSLEKFPGCVGCRKFCHWNGPVAFTREGTAKKKYRCNSAFQGKPSKPTTRLSLSSGRAGIFIS